MSSSALFFSNYSAVSVYIDSLDPVPRTALNQIRQFFGPDDKHTYVKAKFVTKGNVLPEDLIFENRETRYVKDLLPLKFAPSTDHLKSDPSKIPDFQRFWNLNGQISDPHCIKSLSKTG